MYWPNPRWVDFALTQYWPALLQHVPPSWLPVVDVERSRSHRRQAFTEYGCGSYGCVLPTREPGIVCKVTSDPTEAAFVVAALSLDYFPTGLVEYKNIFWLADTTFRGRSIYILWREEAYEVGKVPFFWSTTPVETYDQRAARDFNERLHDFRQVASVVKGTLDHTSQPKGLLAKAAEWRSWAWDEANDIHSEWEEQRPRYRAWSHIRPMKHLSDYVAAYKSRWDIYKRIALGIAVCEVVAEFMANEPGGYLVGEALGFYLDHQILLADVHRNNLGRVKREEYVADGLSPWVITDPGHAVFLSDKYTKVLATDGRHSRGAPAISTST